MVDRSKVVGRIRSAGTELRAAQRADAARREAATTILTPGEVTGDYDSSRALFTTFGTGELRPLTIEDLRQFSRNVKVIGKSFKGGITAKDVISKSRTEDREKATREIHLATPVSYKGGRIQFSTNSGPTSDRARHHVTVELLEYPAAISSPGKVSELAKGMAAGKLKFDCDCGRHTFWFRFISTIGGFNAGRPENGFPKIRNPRLSGVACKHVLRVMHQIQAPVMRPFLVKMIEAGRSAVVLKTVNVSKQDADEIAQVQAKRKHWKGQDIQRTAERAIEEAKHAALKKAAADAKRAAAKLTPAQVAKERAKAIASLKRLQAAGINQRGIEALLKQLGA